jgi:transcriptional regulator with PAS, ATPase and Fis domain
MVNLYSLSANGNKIDQITPFFYCIFYMARIESDHLMGSPSALHLIQKLNEEFDGSLEFLDRELPFARFALIRTDGKGSLPSDLSSHLGSFPAPDQKSLEQVARLRQSLVEAEHQIFVVPCLFQNELLGLLLASNRSGKWSAGEQILIELAATELARLIAPVRAGLTLGPSLKAKTRGKSSGTTVVIGKSKKLLEVLNLVERMAQAQASVLILGESGTGKELLARKVHELSPRKNGPFVAINCGALAENLLESELFGHEKGSFTGAVATKKGLVEAAEGGTLFLDEVGEMPLPLQAKLLRFLQEGEIQRIGGRDPIPVDVRIVSATNRNLEEEVRLGHFREDLYYRLNTLSIKSPALRERIEDLETLMEHFAPGLPARLKPEARSLLQAYRWPGNIRELQNVSERLQILTGSAPVSASDLPQPIRDQGKALSGIVLVGPPPVEMALEDLERVHILRCLEHFEGNKTRAAQSLGITIKTLYNKLHRYGILDKNESKL